MSRTVITGTGAYIPPIISRNEDFLLHRFYDEQGNQINMPTNMIIEKFSKITGIWERRYAPDNLAASDIGAEAAREALVNSGIDPEILDQIIVAHNFGDVASKSVQSQNVPSIASRIKQKLGISNPNCIAYDILFGCPGWVQSLIQTEAYFRAGMAKRVLLIGTETLSRVIDKWDRDSMIFADGAGATVVEWMDDDKPVSGILGTLAQTHSVNEVDYINMGSSFHAEQSSSNLFIKMKGRKVYEYALTHVPLAIKACLDNCNQSIHEVKQFFIHQANEKMDREMVTRLYNLYGFSSAPDGVLPMNIKWLGNSSVATVPTLFHMVRTGAIAGHSISAGDLVVFASVGAGMNINAVCYRI